MILSTSFMGSYMLTRGIAIFTGHFPHQFEVSKKIELGVIDWSNFPKIIYAYVAGVILFTTLFTYVQKRINDA